MNPMTSAGPAANSVFVVTPQNPYPTMPGAVSQGPLYPCNQPQVHLIPGNPPGLQPPASVRPAQRVLKEGKVLGAIQILIGLVYLGLAIVMVSILFGYYKAISLMGGFPFWGSIWTSVEFGAMERVNTTATEELRFGVRFSWTLFIISGSFSVAAEKQPRSCLVNCSLGFNILSAITSMTGMILFIVDITVNRLDVYTDYYAHWGVTPGLIVSSMLLVFSFLEFCVACTATHFGCQLACYSPNDVDMVLPNVIVTHSVVIPETANPPPAYSTEVQAPNKQS